MAYFNILETFFLISLGITFILILFLVYHFKDRIHSIEQKNDTMFEIVNNVVKEMIQLRNHLIGSSPTLPPPTPLSNVKPSLYVCKSTDEPTFISPNNIHMDKIMVSDDDEEEEEDEDEDCDDDDEEEEDEDDEDDTRSPIIMVMDNIDIPTLEQVEEPTLENDIIHTIPSGSVSDEEYKDIILELNNEVDDMDIEEEHKEQKEEDYKNMTPTQLKEVIIKKGLSGNKDLSKMKKKDLLKLLSITE